MKLVRPSTSMYYSLIFRKYHDLSLELLSQCFNEDEALTLALLSTDRLESSQKLTSLEIAAEINNEEFVAHSSSQYLLDTRWSGILDLQDHEKVKVT